MRNRVSFYMGNLGGIYFVENDQVFYIGYDGITSATFYDNEDDVRKDMTFIETVED